VSSTSNPFERSFQEVSRKYLAELRETSSEDAAGAVAEDDAGDGSIIFRDETTAKVRKLAENVARMPTTVLLSGETGVGKEVFARFIHRSSKRADGPFVAVNCAALSASLLESELFGHEKGAFSGAIGQHIGVFERADGGTLLLDEISEMPLELQAKLLRVLQERQVVRVGGTKPIDVDIRIIATTNRDLKAYADEGHFRRDLYFRVNVFPLEIPPLRHRRDDIEPLAGYYTTKMARIFDSDVQGFTAAALRKLRGYAFPGNIRELVNIVERALILADDAELIDEDHIMLQDETIGEDVREAGHADDDDDDDDPDIVQFRVGEDQLTDVRRVIIERTLEHFDGHRSRTAEKLGVSARTIRNKLKDYESDKNDDS
jgi:two-component system response regulator FlrC